MSRIGSNTKPQQAGWSQPLRLHLSVVIVILLLGVSLPLIWLTYDQGTRSAIRAADQQMQLLSQHAIERYRAIFGEGLSAITLASAGKAFLSEPPADLDIKINFLFKALAGSPDIDGIYAGYPTGSFVHAVNVNERLRLDGRAVCPEGCRLRGAVSRRHRSGRRSTWRFYDADNQLITERLLGDPSYDPRARPWYKAASKSAAPVTVGPYMMATTRMLGLTIAAPTDRNETIVIGADVILEAISRLLVPRSRIRQFRRLCFRRPQAAHRSFRRRHDETRARRSRSKQCRR